MRTDLGWYVLDFEGEPSRPLEERQRHTSVLKDVAGMLRSLNYATQFAVGDRAESDTRAVATLCPGVGGPQPVGFRARLQGLQGHRGAAATRTRRPPAQCVWPLR